MIPLLLLGCGFFIDKQLKLTLPFGGKSYETGVTHTRKKATCGIGREQ